MIKIPTFQTLSADFKMEIILGGQITNLRMIYNTRSDYWHLDFTDRLGNSLYGIKIVPSWLLLRQYRGSIDFSGDLLMVKTDDSAGNEITYDNFGNGWDLAYLTETEADTWRNDNGLE